MIGILDLVLRLVIWFLLTADLSLANIAIGVAIALLIPRCRIVPGTAKDWLYTLRDALVAIPKAFVEAIEIILYPHRHEERFCEKAKPLRTPGLIFLDVFLITFTPKTIVIKYHENGWYEVHHIRRRRTIFSRE
ncbi:Na+/H+ antiporter subunit E [Leptolyngbya sp. PCC 6406]|uniref:Na+/H+ antiporter subunit E n=1 Tax=Leptolyngbya sp. PCC 6406 TaxID=1173264 RepID=UPI0002AC576B|nr:Na+/H+ antiporter subunit E [Leptolyngbya sp. PCC 6406]